MNLTQARKYVRSIRNVDKQAYAAQYMGWKVGENSTKPSPANLSYMGAQAVEIHLNELLAP